MNPIFFGPTDRQLYGIYDEPSAGASTRDTAVVLAYPAFPEYHKVHWVFRSLASRVAQEGFFTLRFDYHATGDSAGASEEARLSRWTGDIRLAAEEARDLCGAREVSVVGFRLGASLAARAVDQGLGLRGLVLWDPVVSGPAYLDHQLARARIHRRVRLLSPKRPPGQLLGYRFPEELHREIDALELDRLSLDGAERVEVVATGDDAEVETWVDGLSRRGVSVNLTRSAAGEARRASGEIVRMSAEPVDDVLGALLRTEAS